ncbi:MAG: TldD/PmbA family protein [Alphaproteobacteria bacterium]|nr:TldD/PmbA family protein [Alphaproteobacteria bacterium]
MESFDEGQARQKLADVLAYAKRLGAEAADALYVEGKSIGVSWRGGKLEGLNHSEGGDLGLRVLFGKKQASAATSEHSPKSLKEIAERVVAMAKLAPEDPFCGLADPDQIITDFPVIELADTYEPDVDVFIARARESEEAALAVEGVAQCESSYAGGGETFVALAATNGFAGSYSRTGYHISTSVLVGQDTDMEHDYEYDSVVFQSDLKGAAEIGRSAAQRALKNLGARKMPSCQVPVVFDPRESNGLLGAFLGAISGSSVARGTSFLKEHMGKQVFSDAITIVDDPFRNRGHRSKMFDGEGIKPQRRNFIEKGILQTWMLDLRSSRQLGLTSTGHASRGTTGIPHPSPTNSYIEPGSLSPEELIKDIQSGFYVTQLMGSGVNGVTGDLSQAARGFWIENGQITHPVYEMTIAANLKEMFLNMTAANDLCFRYGVDAPTLRVEGMTVAGV